MKQMAAEKITCLHPEILIGGQAWRGGERCKREDAGSVAIADKQQSV